MTYSSFILNEIHLPAAVCHGSQSVIFIFITATIISIVCLHLAIITLITNSAVRSTLTMSSWAFLLDTKSQWSPTPASNQSIYQAAYHCFTFSIHFLHQHHMLLCHLFAIFISCNTIRLLPHSARLSFTVNIFTPTLFIQNPVFLFPLCY